MAVNYGLGGFEQGSCFTYASLQEDQSVVIRTRGEYAKILKFQTSQYLGQEAGIFSSNFHLITNDDSEDGNLISKSSGVYLISYNLTLASPANQTIQTGIMVDDNVIVGKQRGYNRSGVFQEVGSQALVFLNKDQKISIVVGNIDRAENIIVNLINLSVIKLSKSGRINR